MARMSQKNITEANEQGEGGRTDGRNNKNEKC